MTSTLHKDVHYEGRDLEALAEMPNYYAWIMRWFAPFVRGKAIEYGAGRGTVSTLIRSRCEHLTLVEPSPNLSRMLHRTYAQDGGVLVSDQLFETHVGTVDNDSMDTVVMVNVLEHIEDDRGALKEIARVLAPGGHLLLFVPAMPFLMSDLDRIFGHFRRYRRSELSDKLGAAQLSVLNNRYFDLVGTAPWFIFNTVLRSNALNPGMLRIYDAVFVPLSRIGESLLRPPFGKNILVVARKTVR